MKDIVVFLNDFFKAETDLLNAYEVKPLNIYNSAVEKISEYTIKELNESFGAKMNENNYEVFYNEDGMNPQSPRHIFRIDEYELGNGEVLYVCYVSEINPDDDWKEYYNMFLIKKIDGKLKIITKFALDDMDGPLAWRAFGGDDSFKTEEPERFVLNKKSLGKQIKIHRILEPSNDDVSMQLYNQDEML